MVAPLEFGGTELFWLFFLACLVFELARSRPFKFSLKSFLIFCTIVGVVIGMWARRAPRTAHSEGWNIDGFAIEVWWMSWTAGRDHFGYLVAYPSVMPHSRGADSTHVITTSKGLVVSGRNRSAERPDCKFWICYVTPSGLDVRPIDAECPPEALKDREAFKKSEFWNKHLRPALIEESRRFDRWWFERYGTKNPASQFTPPETWDEWLAERATASPQPPPRKSSTN